MDIGIGIYLPLITDTEGIIVLVFVRSVNTPNCKSLERALSRGIVDRTKELKKML